MAGKAKLLVKSLLGDFVGSAAADTAGCVPVQIPVQRSWQGSMLNTGIAGTYGTDAHDYGARLKALETAVQQLALAVELSSLDQADDHDEKQHAKPDEPGRPVDLTYLPA